MKLALNFHEVKNQDEFDQIIRYDQSAFSTGVGFEWSLKGLELEKKRGWKIIGVFNNEIVVASVLAKKEGKTLLTKTSPVKLDFQGNGFSHQIKDYLEDYAKKNKCLSIRHFCRSDDFRGISLNETHGYKKVNFPENDDENISLWEKTLGS